MIDILLAVLFVSACVFIGMIWGWYMSKLYHSQWHAYELKKEKERYESQLKNINECFNKNLNEIVKSNTIERQEISNRNIQILDEISRATGIDKIELPSFGTIYLSHSEKLRADMQAIYMEDE